MFCARAESETEGAVETAALWREQVARSSRGDGQKIPAGAGARASIVDAGTVEVWVARTTST